MSWIDIRLRKPTEADGDEQGRVFQRLCGGSVVQFAWNELNSCVAWMPIPEFTPLPDPPEGYRFIDPEVEDFREGVKYWNDTYKKWMDAARCMWQVMEIFCVPDPPEPQYRPFASAEEFRPYHHRWWRRKGETLLYPPTYYNDTKRGSVTWEFLLDGFEFDDGTPFGLPVDD